MLSARQTPLGCCPRTGADPSWTTGRVGAVQSNAKRARGCLPRAGSSAVEVLILDHYLEALEAKSGGPRLSFRATQQMSPTLAFGPCPIGSGPIQRSSTSSLASW